MKLFLTNLIILCALQLSYAYADFNPYVAIQNRSSHTIYFTSNYYDFHQINPSQTFDFAQVASGDGHSTIHTDVHIWYENDRQTVMCDIKYSFDSMNDGIYTIANFNNTPPSLKSKSSLKNMVHDQQWTLREDSSDKLIIKHDPTNDKIVCSLGDIFFGSVGYGYSYAAVKPLIVVTDY